MLFRITFRDLTKHISGMLDTSQFIEDKKQKRTNWYFSSYIYGTKNQLGYLALLGLWTTKS